MEDAPLIRRGPYMFTLNERLSEYAYEFRSTSEAVASLLIGEYDVGFDVPPAPNRTPYPPQ